MSIHRYLYFTIVFLSVKHKFAIIFENFLIFGIFYDNYGGFDPEAEKTGTGFGTRYIRNMLALTGCGEMTLQVLFGY